MRTISFLAVLFLQNFLGNTISAAALPNPQNPAAAERKHEGLIFKLNPKSVNVFTEKDATILRTFIEYRAKIVGCDDINLKVYANSKENPYIPINIIDALKQKGYVVVHLDCSNEDIVFQLDKVNNNSDLNLPIGQSTPTQVQDEANLEGACDACGAVMVKKELLDLFKDADYGSEPAIDFNSSFVGDGSSDSSAGIDINALRNKINGLSNNDELKTTLP